MADGHGGPWWAPIVHFATHSVVGTVIFVVVALPAWALGHLVKWLIAEGTARYVVDVLTILEYVIVTVDAVLVVTYLAYAAWKAAKELK